MLGRNNDEACLVLQPQTERLPDGQTQGVAIMMERVWCFNPKVKEFKQQIRESFLEFIRTPEILHIIVIFLCWRVFLYLIAYLSGIVVEVNSDFGQQPNPLASIGNLLFRSWIHWDSGWYLSIAENGYFFRGTEEQSSVAFFPLFPLAMRLFSRPLLLFMGERDALVVAGIVVANTSFICYLVLLFKLTRQVFYNRSDAILIAKRAAIVAMLFPTAIFMIVPYSEALYLLMVIGAFYAARKGNWAVAGGFGALAAIGRLNGVAIVLPLFWEFILQLRNRKVRWWKSLYLGCMPIGLLSFIIYCAWKFNDPFAFLHAMQAPHWRRIPHLPWVSYFRECSFFITHLNNTWSMLQLFYATIFIGLVILSLIYLPKTYAIYAIINLLLPFSTNLVSIQRYVLVIFPGFMILGYLSRRELIWTILLILLSLMQGVNVVLWVNGLWLG